MGCLPFLPPHSLRNKVGVRSQKRNEINTLTYIHTTSTYVTTSFRLCNSRLYTWLYHKNALFFLKTFRKEGNTASKTKCTRRTNSFQLAKGNNNLGCARFIIKPKRKRVTHTKLLSFNTIKLNWHPFPSSSKR